jgi:hypothetical protein
MDKIIIQGIEYVAVQTSDSDICIHCDINGYCANQDAAVCMVRQIKIGSHFKKSTL